MRLKSIGLTVSLMWGGAMLLVGVVHMAMPSYGGEFLRVMSSVYPGADTAPTWGRVLIGTVYGLVDGAFAGLLLGYLYNTFAHQRGPAQIAPRGTV